MTHRFPIKEIALQAGVGTATVDRVLNERANVSPQSRQRVFAAIKELEGQEAQLASRGRRLFFDFVIEAPSRFSQEVRRAAEAVLPEIGVAVCRPRFVAQETMHEDEILSALARITRRGSHGVCLKARDLPSVRDAVHTLTQAGIPVVTLVTDIPVSSRIAYVGLDNASAGRTAAYLLAKFLPKGPGVVLTSQSNGGFLGEAERALAFASNFSRSHPEVRILDIHGGGGLAYETARHMSQALKTVDTLDAVYSMGGGNQAILSTLEYYGLSPKIFIAHDLDRENRALLQDRKLDFVLNHDLRQDIRNAFHELLKYHKLRSPEHIAAASEIRIATPENMPTSK